MALAKGDSGIERCGDAHCGEAYREGSSEWEHFAGREVEEHEEEYVDEYAKADEKEAQKERKSKNELPKQVLSSESNH